MSFVRLLPLLSLCALFCFSQESFARPEMASKFATDRFAAMDADKDGKVSKDEFFAAQPEMKEAAFEAIDMDKDGFISPLEWESFAAGHGKGGETGAMPPHGSGAAHNATSPSLIMPPKDAK